MQRFVIPLLLLTGFCLLSFGQSPQSTSSPIEVSYARSEIQWSVFVPTAGCVLTVSGPDGFYRKQEYGANSRPEFGPVNEQGLPRPEGLYRWELVVQLAPGPGGEAPDEPNPIFSGSFVIRAGKIIPRPEDAQPAMIEEGAPDHSLFLDRAGRLGMGTSVPGSTLHLKGSNPAFTLEDITTGGGLFTWRGLEKGDGSLGLFDKAGQARWLVDSQGRIGIGTTKPTSALTVDGYIEAKGLLVNGRPVGGTHFGLIGGSQPLSTESDNNNFFGTGAGASTAGYSNSFFGADAGHLNTTGYDNSFFGYEAGTRNTEGGANSFFGCYTGAWNTTGVRNSFFGNIAGHLNRTGSDNSFFGTNTGHENTAGNHNSFFGGWAGYFNTTASDNSFFGDAAGYSNTTGYDDCFFGREAGYSNTTGNSNSFFGRSAGNSNTIGYDNSFFGRQAGYSNTQGDLNSFFGWQAGYYNTTGSYNSFFGRNTGIHNTVESSNTFLGGFADLDPGADPVANPVHHATAVGYRAYVAQSNSLVLGSIANVNGAISYVNVGIGTTTPARQLHMAGPNAVFRMDRSTNTASFILVRTDPTGATPWKTFVVGTDASGVNQGEFIINDIGAAVGGGGQRRMTIANDGNVTFTGTVYAAGFAQTSSASFKTNIRTFENALETVNRLRGVRFDWIDSGKPAVGLIAEEVNEVLPELVAKEGGKATGVNYANLVAVLVEAVKEQQETIEKQQQTIQHERTTNEAQQADLDSLKAEMVRLKVLVQGR